MVMPEIFNKRETVETLVENRRSSMHGQKEELLWNPVAFEGFYMYNNSVGLYMCAYVDKILNV
jgi:hypothetical protein